jgi:hypothetical protein
LRATSNITTAYVLLLALCGTISLQRDSLDLP